MYKYEWMKSLMLWSIVFNIVAYWANGDKFKGWHSLTNYSRWLLIATVRQLKNTLLIGLCTWLN